MKILMDECLPEDLKGWLTGLDVRTVRQMGWAGISNGALLSRAEGRFDLFLTADKRLRYQQNLKGHRLAILVLPSNRLKILRNLLPEIQSAITGIVPGRPDQFIELSTGSER